MSQKITNYASKLFSQYPIKKQLIQMLRPYDLARFTAYQNLYLSDYEKKKYLNYIFDVIDYPFWEKDKQEYQVILYGIDVTLLLSRLDNPLEYEKRYGYNYILKIAISIVQKDNLYNSYPISSILQDKFAFPLSFYTMNNEFNTFHFLSLWKNHRWVLSQITNESKVLLIVSVCDYFDGSSMVPMYYQYPFIESDIGIVDISGKGYYTNYIKVSNSDNNIVSIESLQYNELSSIENQKYLTLVVKDNKYYGEICI